MSCCTLGLSPPVECKSGGKKVSAATRPMDYSLYLKSGHRSPMWDDMIESGFQSFDAGNLPTSYIFLGKAFDQGCRDGLVLFRLGIYYESVGQYKEAAEALLQAAEKLKQNYPNHPLSGAIHEHTARALYQANDPDRALPELQKGLQKSPNNFMLLFLTGQILREKGFYNDAKQVFEKALGVRAPKGVGPDAKLRLLTELMIVTFELRQLDASQGYADKVLAISPNDPAALSYKQRIEQARLKTKEP